MCINAVERFTFWQKMNCCYAQKRRKAQVENFLHFEESENYFPIEYHLMFGGANSPNYQQQLVTNQSIDDMAAAV